MVTHIKFTLIVLTALGLVACGQDDRSAYGTPTSSIINGTKIYRHSIDGKPTSLDPIKASTIYSNFLVVNIFDTLYSYKYLARPYQLKPNLAAAMPTISEDGLRYEIKLKTNARFHDHPAFDNGQGRAVVASDVVYSIKRSFDPKNNASGAWLWQGKIQGLDDWKTQGADYDVPVAGLQAIDDHTLVIQLTQAYPQLIYSLATGFSGIVPREVVAALGAEFGSKPIGSGPFYLDRFDSETAYLKKNPRFRSEPLDIYFEGFDEAKHGALGIQALHGLSPPFVDQLEINFIKETASRWQSFTKGNEIQYTTVPKDKQNTVLMSRNPIRLHPQITQNYHHSYGIEAGFVYHGFNMQDPTFGHASDPEQDAKNKALRCAIRQVHDWQQKNQAFYFGLGTVFPGIIPPSVPEYDPNLSRDSITTDVAAAKALLAAHGWQTEDLPVFEYHVNGSVLQKQFFEQLRGFLNQLGYPNNRIEYVPYPSFGNFNQAVKNRQVPFFFMGWTLDYPDAENTLQLFYGPNEAPGSNNFNYQNPAFDALFEQSSTMQPSPERTRLYQQMNQMVIDDCVVISGLSRNKIHLWHKNVITFPDREIVGGFHLRYVDVK
ncbi:ABC transporter substrate-binding protein [Marinicella meishanensis]|uniref:ABC transporter substrate-binding protein n=1 Tax=Marinicella meishanensis TaxID=2873263 RepID=UPI001CBC21A5|nr:ABC transporter substrate-binding protein [Marinicella sp. NBU2979]